MQRWQRLHQVVHRFYLGQERGKLRQRQGAAAVPVSGSVVLPAIYVVATVGLALLASSRQPAEWGAAAITVLSGLVVYRVFRSRRAAGGRGS